MNHAATSSLLLVHGVTLTFVMLLLLNVVQTDLIEDHCSLVQCPQIPDCPADSLLHTSSDEVDDFDADYDEELPSSNRFVGVPIEELGPLEHSTEETKLLVTTASATATATTTAKTTPLERRRKRELLFTQQSEVLEEDSLLKHCCNTFQCVCQPCAAVPKCVEPNQVAVELRSGNGQPGECCATYECVPKQPCSAAGSSQVYWRDSCTKCSCFGGVEEELCQHQCQQDEPLKDIFADEDDQDERDEPLLQHHKSCYSTYLQKPMLHGELWLEDADCSECSCSNGERSCFTNLCAAVECENPVKVPGKCCPLCKIENEAEIADIPPVMSATEPVIELVKNTTETAVISVTTEKTASSQHFENSTAASAMESETNTTEHKEVVASSTSTTAASESTLTNSSTTGSPAFTETSTTDASSVTAADSTSTSEDNSTSTDVSSTSDDANSTSADANVTSADVNSTSTDANATSADASSTSSDATSTSDVDTSSIIEDSSTTNISSESLDFSPTTNSEANSTNATVDPTTEIPPTLGNSTQSSTDLIEPTTLVNVAQVSFSTAAAAASSTGSSETPATTSSPLPAEITSTTAFVLFSPTSSPFTPTPTSTDAPQPTGASSTYSTASSMGSSSLPSSSSASSSTTSAPAPLEPQPTVYRQNDPALISPTLESDYNMVSTQQQMRDMFAEIDSVIIIALLLGCLLSIGLCLVLGVTYYNKEKKKAQKRLYSAIPNSETSLSQTSTNTMLTV